MVTTIYEATGRFGTFLLYLYSGMRATETDRGSCYCARHMERSMSRQRVGGIFLLLAVVGESEHVTRVRAITASRPYSLYHWAESRRRIESFTNGGPDEVLEDRCTVCTCLATAAVGEEGKGSGMSHRGTWSQTIFSTKNYRLTDCREKLTMNSNAAYQEPPFCFRS